MSVESVHVIIDAEDNASQIFDKVSDKADSTFGGMGGIISGAGQALLGFGTALGVAGTALGGFAIKSADTFEKGLLKYEVLLKSTEEAQTRMAELNEFAAVTPFQLEDIIKGDVMLEGFGIRSEDLLTRIGNAAAISGSEFNDLALIMGQLSQSKDLENIKQLVERGVISFNELKEAGIEFAKDGSVVNTVEETFSAVNDIIEDKFAGGMEKMSNTVSGKWSTLMDTFTLSMADFGEKSGLMDFAKQVLDFAIEKLPGAMETVKTVMSSAAEKVNEFTEPLIEFFKNNKDEILEFFNTVKETGVTAFGKFADIASGTFELVGNAVGTLKDVWDRDFLGISSSLQTAMSTLKYFGTIAFEVLGGVVDSVSYLFGNWEYLWNKMMLTGKEFANSMVSTIETFVNAIIDGVNKVLPEWAELDNVSLNKYKYDTTKESAFVSALKPEESLSDKWAERADSMTTAAQTYLEELAAIEARKEQIDAAAAEREARIIEDYKSKQEVTINQYINNELKDDATVALLLEKLQTNNRSTLASYGVTLD